MLAPLLLLCYSAGFRIRGVGFRFHGVYLRVAREHPCFARHAKHLYSCFSAVKPASEAPGEIETQWVRSLRGF